MIKKELQEEMRKNLRNSILYARKNDISLYDLTDIVKEEYYKIEQEEREKRIKRTPEEQEFRKKAEKFLLKHCRTFYKQDNNDEKSYRLPIFETEGIFNICLEILCVYRIEGIATENAYKTLGERLEMKRSLLEMYEWNNLYCSIVLYYGIEKKVSDENIEIRFQKINDFMLEIQND